MDGQINSFSVLFLVTLNGFYVQFFLLENVLRLLIKIGKETFFRFVFIFLHLIENWGLALKTFWAIIAINSLER